MHFAMAFCKAWLQNESIKAILRKDYKFLKRHLSFFRLHLAYFITISIFGTLILWGIGSSRPGVQFKFIDCLYNITSALCVTGLSSVPMEYIPAGGQFVLMLMMILGGQVSTSVVPLLVKKRRYCNVARLGMKQQIEDRGPDEPSSSDGSMVASPGRRDSAHNMVLRRLSTTFIMAQNNDDLWMTQMAPKKKAEHLKDVFEEYQATVMLIRIVIGYYVVIHLVGFFIAWLSIACSPHASHILGQKKVNKGFFALFVTVSSFANSGQTLTNENMVPFNNSVVLMLDLMMLMLLGNTLYAPALRNVIWLLHRYTKGKKDVYEFLLTHPRRCYTHLFPQVISGWLVLAVTLINGFECLMFYILDWHSRALKGFGTGSKILNGLFQSLNTRSCGMNSLNLPDLSAPMLFLYTGSMYVAAYPVFLSRQYSRDRHRDVVVEDRDIHDTTMSTQSRRLLAHDWAYLFLAMFFICVSENSNLKRDSANYSIFNIIFESISAYGNVGLSLGYSCSLRTNSAPPCEDLAISFSGKWGVVGKLFIIVVMFLGRHRGLPDNIDSAILMPEEKFSNFMPKAPPLACPSRSECTDDGMASSSSLLQDGIRSQDERPRLI